MLDNPSLEELLSRSAPQPGEPFAADLRSRAMQTFDQYRSPATIQTTRQRTRRLVWAWSSALVLVLLISLFFTPPGRALAQAILQLGWFVFTDEPTAAEQHLTTTPELEYSLVTVHADVTSASQTAGFPVYYPGFLPEGYIPMSLDPGSPVEIVYNTSEAVSSVGAMFEQAGTGKILSFTQIPFKPAPGTQPYPFGTGSAEPQSVFVSGNEGVWLEEFSWGTKLDENGEIIPVPYNLLIWEVTTQAGDTFQFWLGSEERLPMEVMIQIAESVAP